jgi:hypothetical protein
MFDPKKLFTSFVEVFASSRIAKDRVIPNPIGPIEDVVEEHDDGDEERHGDGVELA